MRRLSVIAAVGFALLGVGVMPAHAQSAGGRFKVVDIGPGLPLSIDSQGEVVGTMLVNNHTHPFLWKDNGGLTDLFLQGMNLGGQEAFAYGVSVQGAERRIVGSAFTGNGQLHAFASGSGGGAPGMTDLNGLSTFNGGQSSVAYGVNALGEVVGYGYRQDNSRHAFRWEPAGVMVDLGTLGGQDSVAWAINSGSEVVGTSTAGNGGSYATVWSSLIGGGQPFQIPFAGSEGLAISDQRLVAGRGAISLNPIKIGAFTYNLATSTLTQLPGLANAAQWEARGVNGAGWVVGFSTTSAIDFSKYRATLWRGTAISDLNSMLSSSGWTLYYATAVNDNGQITGVGAHGNQARAFRLDPIPTPPTITNATATPKKLTNAGGTVTVSATVTSFEPLGLVSARLGGTGVGALYLQQQGSSNLYSATYPIPPNTSHKVLKYTFNVSAATTTGKTAQKSAGTVTVGK